MDLYDVKTLKEWLDRIGSLPSYQRDLIDEAIFAIENNLLERARRALTTMARNYRNDRNDNAAHAVERLL